MCKFNMQDYSKFETDELIETVYSGLMEIASIALGEDRLKAMDIFSSTKTALFYLSTKLEDIKIENYRVADIKVTKSLLNMPEPVVERPAFSCGSLKVLEEMKEETPKQVIKKICDVTDEDLNISDDTVDEKITNADKLVKGLTSTDIINIKKKINEGVYEYGRNN